MTTEVIEYLIETKAENGSWVSFDSANDNYGYKAGQFEKLSAENPGKYRLVERQTKEWVIRQ